ncbi:hypothetical protein SPFM6_00015 [Salmonella phage SPFM6]|nr:hypothetical protein SPFM6_00015 [Salmonella phage SPFM6]
MPKPLQLEGLASVNPATGLRWDGTIASHEEIGPSSPKELAELLGAKVECHPKRVCQVHDGN